MTIRTFGLNTTNDVQSWADAGIQQSAPNVAQGENDRFCVSNVSGNQSAALVHCPGMKTFFDSVGTVTINSVTLRLRRLNNVTAPNRNVQLRRLLVPFTEAKATWNIRATGTPWGTAGAKGAGDADSTILGTGSMPSGAGAYFSVTGAGLSTWVSNVNNGSIPDYGLLLELENPGTIGSGDFDIGSRERTDGQRPFIEIDYTAIAYPTVSTTDVTVNNLSGNAVVTITLSSDALVGGVSGTVNTADITAIAGVDYTAQTGVAFSIPEGQTSGTITIPILP